MHHLHGYKFEAFLFEAFDDFTDKSSLDSIGLEHDKGSFTISGHFGWVFFKDVFSIVTRNFLACCYCKKRQNQSEAKNQRANTSQYAGEKKFYNVGFCSHHPLG